MNCIECMDASIPIVQYPVLLNNVYTGYSLPFNMQLKIIQLKLIHYSNSYMWVSVVNSTKSHDKVHAMQQSNTSAPSALIYLRDIFYSYRNSNIRDLLNITTICHAVMEVKKLNVSRICV